jgi:ketosteroid isomerase-like protein
MRIVKPLTAALAASVVLSASAARAQGPADAARGAADLQAGAAAVMKADADFAQSVAEKNRDRFLSFVADVTTFNGGSASELHSKDAVWKAWADFFAPGGPTLTWAPIKGEVIGAGDLGYTIGRSLLKGKGPDGKPTERRGQYLTIWRKQADGSWKAIFDTGSTLP